MFTNDFGHWKVEINVPDVTPFGFIYKITNKKENKSYIGKKQIFSKIKRKPLKGKKNRRISVGESDWRTYKSSSNQINKIIEDEGMGNFEFEILSWCESKWELAYLEALTQFKLGVLLYPDKFYNGIINMRVGTKPKDFIITEKFIL